MDLVFVGDRCCDHSPSSGYDQICSLFPEAGWLSGRALEAGHLQWHRDGGPSKKTASPIFHVIYGDCSGKALPEILRRRFPGAVIVSSAHQPIARLKADRPAWAALGASDVIVTVSKAQVHELEVLGLPIHAIPHGVWTKAFRPTAACPAPLCQNVLIVGSFLRDWEGAKQVVKRLAREGVRSIALGVGAQKNLAGHDSSLEVPPRVTEVELVELYERSAVLFLPFLEATASNALLEAMSAGCPVVCPRLLSIVDEYLGDDIDAFEAGRYDDAAARILNYVRDPSAREARGQELMTRANKFDWYALKPHYAAIYEDLATTPEVRRSDESARSSTSKRGAVKSFPEPI